MDDASIARRIARSLRRAPERVLHPRRRAGALRRIVAAPPESVLFVCYGNICRSPFAEALAGRLVAERRAPPVHFASAGFFGPDRPAPEDAIAAARAQGVDLSAHRSQLLTPALALSAKLIVVMEARQKMAVVRQYGRRPDDVIVLGDLDPLPISRRDIRDPVEQPRAVFDETYKRIERCVRPLVDAIAHR